MNANQAHLLQVLLHHIQKKPALCEHVQRETEIDNLALVIQHELRPAVEAFLTGPMA